jgi:hypothetical protein
MTSPLRRKPRITAWPTTARRGAISLAALALAFQAGLAPGQQPPSVARSVEKTIYLQKPAEGVIPAQAVAPPAPPPVFSPLGMPRLLESGTPATTETYIAQPPAPVAPTPPMAQPTEPKLTLNLPKRDDIFRFDSDKTMAERIKRELSEQYKIAIEMPAASSFAAKTLTPRTMPPMQVQIEPAYVVHRRLFFEHKNSERAGWDLGAAQPVASALHFYADVLLYPYRAASNPLEPYDTSAGKCLPGCPTPLLVYPPEITLFGFAVGSATIYGTQAILP